ncbi:MAG: DUF2254 family protein [Planktotalea sp.]|uniref:DUF2254 domain-containing protein n=1 Tax=Planktotalea sp. TaxID=2029877 RepID=UPI003C72D40B
MLQSIFQYLAYFARRLIVRVSLYAVFALASVGAAILISPYLPEAWVTYLGADSLETVLTTLASSMLAVTIFSLSILSSSFRGVESSATPRAVLILREDQTTHRILSVFIGAFLFSLTGIIVLATPLMSNATRFVLFLVSIVIVVQVVIAIIRWIHHIERFGLLENILDCTQAKAHPALAAFHRSPTAGANAFLGASDAKDGQGFHLYASKAGYVTMIAADALQQEAQACNGRVYIHVRAGDYVNCGDLLLQFTGLEEPSEVRRRLLGEAIVIRASRSFEQDAEFGLIVMSEVANRALSPGINDPQTAVDVVNRLSSLMLAESESESSEVCFDRLWIKPLQCEQLFRCSFDVIARSGGDIPEVQVALTRVLAVLSDKGSRDIQHCAKNCAARLGVEL